MHKIFFLKNIFLDLNDILKFQEEIKQYERSNLKGLFPPDRETQELIRQMRIEQESRSLKSLYVQRQEHNISLINTILLKKLTSSSFQNKTEKELANETINNFRSLSAMVASKNLNLVINRDFIKDGLKTKIKEQTFEREGDSERIINFKDEKESFLELERNNKEDFYEYERQIREKEQKISELRIEMGRLRMGIVNLYESVIDILEINNNERRNNA